ncbi:MAG: RHS repeat-associated core domain-containing protein [Bryobacterales bacterium]|nr:RHS repeat-associated core domain-containing protein [Bryobacterales bacterium]
MEHSTGKERDAETGLDYFGARYFSGAQGRFTTPDPTFMTKQRISDPQQWNLYAYVRNNPLMYVDPDGKELKLAIYNSSGLARNVATRVADRVAGMYRAAGVKNVTYTLHEGRPSAATAMMYGLGPTPHSHLLEIRPSRAGSPAIRSGEGGHNWDFGGHSAVDASVVTNKSKSLTQLEVGLANVATHEIGHDRLGHVDSPTNIMNSTGAADPNWLFNPNLMFTPPQAQILQNQYNRPGEVDITPPSPPPPPPPPKLEEEEKREPR